MSVEFEEDSSAYQMTGSRFNTQPNSTLVKLALKSGLAKDKKTAYMFFVIIIVACILLTIAIYLFTNAKSDPTYIEDIPNELKAVLPKEVLKTIPSREE
jgi:hypothetical protein